MPVYINLNKRLISLKFDMEEVLCLNSKLNNYDTVCFLDTLDLGSKNIADTHN